MKTILLIDDDQQLRAMFAVSLRKGGYHVIEADSGDSGLKMARQQLPDLILSDIHMPSGDGSTLLRDIRRDPELKTKQVVLMTGRPDIVTPRKGMENGADDFLIKPVSWEALRSCVEARFSRASVSWRVEDQMLAHLRSSVPSHLPHEFFTPLAGIIGLMEILRSEFPALAPEEVQDIHNDVYQSALRLHRTLRNYLLILDLETGAPDALLGSLSPSRVEEAVRAGVDEALRLNLRKDNLTVCVEACFLSVKPGDLSRMVEELVDNACKFSRQGTPIRVELSAGGHLSITDEGKGMSPEEISQIGAFQQFGRKKNEQQGLGLGLVLVQKLTALYDGKFLIKSGSGDGTRVEITFPPT